MIDRAAEIRSRVSVRDMIEQTVPLKLKGKELSGLCPFHADRHPSLSVNEKKGLWVCRSCHAGGTVIDWVMHRDGMSVKQAIDYLAKVAGLSDAPLTSNERRQIQEASDKRRREEEEERRLRGHLNRGYEILHNLRRETDRLKQVVQKKRDMEGPAWDSLAAAYKKRDTVRLWVDQHDGFANEFAGQED